MGTAANPFDQTGAGKPASTTLTNGAVNPADPNASAALAGMEQPAAAPEPYILPSLDDPTLTAETLTAKEGDAYATPPPPAEGIYRVKLSLRGVTAEDMPAGANISEFLTKCPVGSDGKTAAWVADVSKDYKTGQVTGSYGKTIMEVKISDPRFPEQEGVFLGVPFKWVDTRKKKQSNVSTVETILSCSKQPSGQPWLVTGQNYSPLGLITTFVKFLSGEPEVKALVHWEWNCQACGEAAKKTGQPYPKPVTGMTSGQFRQLKPGVYDPNRLCQIPGHGMSRARAIAGQFFALEYKG